MAEALELVIITGMSGAGKTVAMQSFEDLGYFCVDNMPPSLLTKFWDIVKESGKITRIALVIDLRSRAFFDEIMDSIIDFDNTALVRTRILFLDCQDEALVSRYKETRRTHPLVGNTGLITDGISRERQLLVDLKTRAQIVIDTTNISPRQLRENIMTQFKSDDRAVFHIEVMSFGFKYGVPIDADIVMDVRFLPNPHYVPELRSLTGLDEEVYDYVMKQPETSEFYKRFEGLIDYIVPGYKKEGKTSVVIAIGCTGGQHRSVALTERLGNSLMVSGYPVNITHRDKDKRKETVNRS
ncbi:RNase adapter RapZ [Granulicatella sp. zg-ZJ]|uniref:RNase adapter RapZ n=1 Tax=unclassified Granulicatella TaxID=2630493 RepID=UPI0013BF0603|nr:MULTISPECIES: RNase adapter RapZ [unclassified Granulicatella]MBS4750215.1 RNase adapter RapZ [Carnobacteriaceae bacterium zg-ZUI78]NEW63347.1 RNase adapter RapZ [Granulicatella sp. zg-ZJ]NEW65689.1 RNase adapter RapZ [Granulicatella sp. zg-84]QMI85671.1 RNase adapter RapZ [Carnobacteriaceae bacterium zg-84]